MDVPEREDVTRLMIDWSNGDPVALDQLMPMVYSELRSLASRYLRRERIDHTLQPTALVNEAYLRLVDQRSVRWQNRAHFFGVAAQMMRRILVDHAKSHHRAKRGGGARKVSLEEAIGITDERADGLIALDEADAPGRMDERKARCRDALLRRQASKRQRRFFRFGQHCAARLEAGGMAYHRSKNDEWIRNAKFEIRNAKTDFLTSHSHFAFRISHLLTGVFRTTRISTAGSVRGRGGPIQTTTSSSAPWPFCAATCWLPGTMSSLRPVIIGADGRDLVDKVERIRRCHYS